MYFLSTDICSCAKRNLVSSRHVLLPRYAFHAFKDKKVEEAKQVWADLRSEEVLFDQHTYADIVRAFSDGNLPVWLWSFMMR